MSLLTELAAAVDERARARLRRRLLSGKSSDLERDKRGKPILDDDGSPKRVARQTPSLKTRISRRAALSEAYIRALQDQARVLIADPTELRAALAALRRLHRTFRKHAAEHHRTFDLPAHRPADERQFRADCQRIMKRHRIGPTRAATIIVKQVAKTLPKGARADLLGPWDDEREQVQHLADLLRKRV